MEIRAQWSDFRNSLDILICKELPDGSLSVVKPVDLVLARVEEMGKIEPTFSLPEAHGIAFLSSMSELLRQLKFKPPSESKVEGLYEAASKHLEDMRKLVFVGVDLIENQVKQK